MANEHTQAMKPSLKNSVIYLYGIGEFGYNFVYTFYSYYVMTSLLNYVGVSAAVAAALYSALSWVKFFALPVAGGIVEAVNPKKGKYRKLCIGGAVFMAAGITMEMMHFSDNQAAAAVIFMIVSIIGWVGYGVMYTAYRTLMVPMCKAPADAVALSTASNQVGSIARIIYSPMAMAFMGMAAGFAAAWAGYALTGAIFGVIMIVCMIIVGIVTKPYEDAMEGKLAGMPKQKITGKDIANTLANKPMLIFVLTMMFRGSVLTIVTTLLVTYLTYVVGASQSIIMMYMMITYFVQFVGASVVRWATNKWGRKQIFIISTLISVIFIVGVKFSGSNTTAIIALMSAFQFCGIFVNALIPVFMSDVGDYIEITKGQAAKGFVQSIGGSALMLSAIVGSMVAAIGLAMTGYTAEGAQVGLSDGVKTAITNLFAYGPSVMSIISCIIFLAYPLTEKKMEELRAAKAAAAEAEAGAEA